MLAERLQGLLLLFAGIGSMALIYLAQQHGWLQLRMPTPPGIRPELVPVVTPVSLIFPMATLGALALCWVGLKKLFDPDDWKPPKH